MLVYMQVEQIAGVGQSIHQGTLDWILLENCKFGFDRTDAGSGSAQGGDDIKIRVLAKAIVFTRRSDRATTKLGKWLLAGDPRTVQIEYCLRPDDLFLVRLKLDGAQLRSYGADSQKEDESVLETWQLDFEDFYLEYWEQGKTNQDKDFGIFELKSGL